MDHKVSKDMISSGMIPSGEKTQADLGRTQYGSAPSPSSLMEAYRSIYEHHQKDKDGNTIPHEGEQLNEENLEERRGASVQQLAQNRKDAFKKPTPSGSNKRAEMSIKRRGDKKFVFNKPTGASNKRAEMSIKRREQNKPTSSTPVKTSTAGGGVADAGGTSTPTTTTTTVTTSTPTTTSTSKPTPKPSAFSKTPNQQRAQSMAKDRIASGKSISQVKAANKQSMRDRARDRFAAFKARRLMSDVDLFDIVKGQLIDEGYEEKEVIKIMINLSEDQLNELLGGRPGDGYIGHPNLKIKNPLAKQQITKPVMPNAQGGGLLNKTAGQLGDRKMQLQKLMKGM